MSWWIGIWLIIGFSTSTVYLLRHYLPNIKYTKNKMIKEGIDVSDNMYFSKFRIFMHSLSIMTVFTLFSPLLTLGLFNTKMLNNLDREKILKKACA